MEALKKTKPFILLLFKPTKAFRTVLDDKKSHIALLFVCASLANATQRFWSVSSNISFFSSLWVSCLIAMAVGWIGYYLCGVAIYHWNKLFDGKGDLRSTLTVLAWSFVPSIIGLITYFTCYISFGEKFFQKESVPNDKEFIKTILFYFNTGLNIWSFYLLCKGLMLVNGFSLIKTLATLFLLAACILVLPFLAFLYLRS
jgi:hypothetical protein